MPRYHPLDRRKITPQELRERRLALGLATKELAALYKVDPATIARWENGSKPISVAGAVELALRYLESVDEAQARAFQDARKAQRGA